MKPWVASPVDKHRVNNISLISESSPDVVEIASKWVVNTSYDKHFQFQRKNKMLH